MFTGSGNDQQDGDLNGESLVWESDLNGGIGNGETVTSDTLAEMPSIDTAFFPDAKAFTSWSSSTYAFDTNKAWSIDFNGGNAYGGAKTADSYVRAVGGGQ